MAFVQSPAQERFPAAARQRIDDVSRRQSIRASARSRTRASAPGTWRPARSSGGRRLPGTTGTRSRGTQSGTDPGRRACSASPMTQSRRRRIQAECRLEPPCSRHRRIAIVIAAGAPSLARLARRHPLLRLGLTLAHYDARAHLVVARRILDSLTPGWQQIGAVWLPLPHVLNMLPVQVDAWYRSGASGVAISVLSMALGGRIARVASCSRTTGSIVAALHGRRAAAAQSRTCSTCRARR